MSERLIYKCTWICSNCKLKNERLLTKFEAAFCESLKLKNTCKKCQANTYGFGSRPIPDIDKELLDSWLADKKLFFLCQDEALIMSSTSSQLLINAHKKANRNRSFQLLHALLVKTYDEGFADDKEKQVTHEFILKHQNHWKRVAMGYIIKGVKKNLGIR